MTKQLNLFLPVPDPCPLCDPPPTDTNVIDEDRPRLRGQNARILARLKEGPATVDELADIARKYTSRISDLRAAGYSIDCTFQPGGNNIYTLRTT